MKSNRKRLHLKSEAFQAHFRLLGLKRGECRANIIRSAAQAMSIALTHEEPRQDGQAVDVHRANIAFAAYRLLDPRERSDLYERVQLTYPLDREDEMETTIPTDQLIRKMPPVRRRPKSKMGPRRITTVKLMGQPVIEQAIEEVPGGGQDGSDPPEVILSSNDSDLSLDERRSIVRMLRESQESTLRGLSPIGWIRSRLGL